MPETVISDTTPLQYLHQLGCLELLPTFYGSLMVPEGVVAELAVGRAQGVFLPDLHTLSWLHIQPAPHLPILPLAADLGRGERETLALAVEHPGALALLDDGLARQFARHLGVAFTGTLGILLKAKQQGHVAAVQPRLDQLQRLGFWLDASTRASVLRLAGES